MKVENNNFEFLQRLYESIDGKLDSLDSKLDSYHQEQTNRLHELDKTVQSHETVLSWGKWIFSTSGLLGLLALCKDWLGFGQK